MAKNFKRFLSATLAVILVLGVPGLTAIAKEVINGNDWYGDEVAVDVTAGTDGYNYMSLFRKPVHGYEFSGHFMGDGEGPQTFVLLDTVAHDGTTWTPSGVYEHGNSNYEVVYCCDVETMIVDGTYYKRVNLEDSGYYTDAEAAKIRAILTNAYPYVSVETMKEKLAEAGFANADGLTRNEIIAAVQTAVWCSANGVKAEDLRYQRSYKVSDNLQWGYPMHDTSAETGLDVSGKRVFKTYEEVGARIDGLVDYLLGLEPVQAENGQIVITQLDILNTKPAKARSTEMDFVLNVKLNHSGDADDNVAISVTVDGTPYGEPIKIVPGQELYQIPVTAAEGAVVKAVVSGTQNLDMGVYFYEPKAADVNGDGVATSREVSQNLVGVAGGETQIYAEATAQVNNGELTAQKEANKLEDGKYEVSITVPGNAKNAHDEVILMVDGSYSMDNEWPAMKDAINAIGAAILNDNGNTQLTLMAFGMGDNIVLEHVKSAEDLAAALGELPGNLLYGRSSTNCEAGFTGVAEYIANHDATLGEVNVIFISDGNINTDETLRAFDANWQTWTKFGALTVAQETFGGAVSNGENLPAAFITVFGDRFDGATREEIMERAFGGEVTDEEFLAFAEQVWTDVYAYSGLTRGVAYPVSDAERAFVKYDKENGTYIQDLFYYTTYKSAFVTYGDRWTRTPAAADALAAMEQVKALYVVDYDGYTAWMDTGITSEKSVFIQSNGIAGLIEALEGTINTLATTPYNDVVITDFMSKWVNIDLSTLKIVDNRTGEVIWTITDGWAEGVNPLTKEAPVVIKKLDASEYIAGGPDVAGNMSGDVYLLTWYVKDGALLRSDNYSLKYEVTVDTAEEGFVSGTNYPANGYTDLTYKNFNGMTFITTIDVPNVKTPQPLKIFFQNGQASNISFMLIDKATGEVEFLYKIDIGNQTSFDIPYAAGKISAVFVKQSTSGMFWFSENVDEDIVNATIECLKDNNPSYKGHNAVAFGAGDHELEFKKNKFVTYTFTGEKVETTDEPVADNTVVEDVVEDTVVEDTTVEDAVVEESKNNNGNNGNGNGNNKNKNK